MQVCEVLIKEGCVVAFDTRVYPLGLLDRQDMVIGHWRALALWACLD